MKRILVFLLTIWVITSTQAAVVDFISRPGGHTWPYWTNAVKYQLLFMRNYFDSPGH